MAKPLVFMMGRSPVFLPTDRVYAPNHMWALGREDGCRVGLTAYAVKLLGDLRHLDWSIEAGATITAGQPIAFIEGSKATSDLYAPMGGKVLQLNEAVVADPTLLNSNLYDTGWLLALPGSAQGLMSPEDYLSHLEASWPLAQRLLKGQLGGDDGR